MAGQEDQYMDDLFGEAEDIPLSTAPIIKGLPQRLDELSLSNCCQRIAWSRFGCIAAVGEDGRRVDLYTFIRDADNGSWNLSRPIPLWPPLGESHQIVHIMWSHMGNDLTVVDSCGRVLIYSTGFALGQMMLVKQTVNDSDDEMSAIVGLHWLPVFPHTQKSGIFWSATKVEEEWNFRMSHHLSPGPYNPAEGKSALVCITKYGVLRLLYQQRDGRWLETIAELEDTGPAVESSITHASFAPDIDNSLLLVIHQVSGSLRLFRININWNQSDQKDGQQGQQSSASPSLAIIALVEENSCSPTCINSAEPDLTATSDMGSSISYQLSHLELVPPAPEQGVQESTKVTVIAVFTVLPLLAVVLDITHHYQHACSVISRWTLQKNIQEKLLPCFETLSVKKKSAIGARQRIRLERLSDVTLSAAVLLMRSLRNSTMFVLGLTDGTIHFRSRETMDVVTADGNDEQVHTMPQSGFAFPTMEPSLHIALSPSACVTAVVKPDGSVKTVGMQHARELLNDFEDDKAKQDSLAAVLALQHSSACMQYQSTDDLISILPQNLGASMTHTFLACACKFLNITFDFVSEESQKQIPTLYRNHVLYKCLSVQSTLGSADRRGPRKLAARLAWITINLRLVSLNISKNLRSNENLRAEMAISFVGLVKWSLDLFVYILQEIFRLYYEIKHKEHEGTLGLERDREWIMDYIRSKYSPALLVLLSSIPRILLRMMFRPLRHGLLHSTNGFKTATSVDHKLAFSKLLQVYQTTPIAIAAFEQFLMDVDNLVKSCYRKAGLADAARMVTEREMFLTCTMPAVLMPAVTEMLTTKLDTLMGQQDPGKIHSHDVRWLGLNDDKRSKLFAKSQLIDVIRKLPLGSNARLRRCPRCGSVMEDISMHGGSSGAQQQWVWESQKTCICFDSWASPEPRTDLK